jgi:hypothetical protein
MAVHHPASQFAYCIPELALDLGTSRIPIDSPGAALGGLLSSAIGDRTAVLLGASVGLCIAGEKFHAYFGG